VAIDSDGSIWFSGYSDSPDLPLTPDAWHACHPLSRFGSSGPSASFIGRISSDGRALLYGSFLGNEWDFFLDSDHGVQIVALDGAEGVFLRSMRFAQSSPMRVYHWTRAPRREAGVVCVANVGHGYATAIAPGLLVRVRGYQIGPENTQRAAGGAPLPKSLGDYRLLFDGRPGALIEASRHEFLAIVPFQTTSEGKVLVEVEGARRRLPGISVVAAPASPAVVTLESKGVVLAAVVHADGTLNSRENPAAPGSIVTIYATGLGGLVPALDDGAITASPGSLAASPYVQVYYSDAQILYAGPAPGMVAGVYQINFRVPDTRVQGWIWLGVFSGGMRSQVDVCMFLSCATSSCFMGIPGL